jgi:osmoprotectant transport system permease protein
VEWFVANWSFIWGLAWTHLSISIPPIILGSFIAIVMARVIPSKFVTPTRTILGAIYAIPSLALFVVLPAVLGTKFIGPTNVIIALTIYAITSMYFSARDAFSQVPVATMTTSRALGMNSRQIFVHVELPLAVPGLISGLRVAAASTISIASIGAVVGVRNLGYLFIDGFQRKIPEEIISGLVAISVIALALDVGLWLLGRAMTPWRHAKVARA